MSDWLSQIEDKKKREEARSQKSTQKWLRETRKKVDYGKESYEKYKDNIEEVYKNIEDYVKRAASMKFNVTTLRTTKESLQIEPLNHSPKGYPHIYLEPYGNNLQVTFVSSGEWERRTISLNRISDRVIGEWVKYVADHYNNGYGILKRSKYFAAAVFVLGLFMLPYSYRIAGGFGVVLMLFITGFFTYKANKIYI